MKRQISNFITIFLMSAFIFSSAQSEETIVVHNMEEMLSAIHLEKKQINSMVEKMVKSGRLSPEEGAKARREIASIKESDIEIVQKAAISQLKSDK